MAYTDDVVLLDGQLQAYFERHRHGAQWSRAALVAQQEAVRRLYQLAAFTDQQAAQAEQAAQAAAMEQAEQAAGVKAEAEEKPPAPCAGCEEKKAGGRVTVTPKGKADGT